MVVAVLDPHAGVLVEAGRAGAVLAVDVEVDLADPTAVELAEPVPQQGLAEASAALVTTDGQLADIPAERAGIGQVDPASSSPSVARNHRLGSKSERPRLTSAQNS